MDAKLFFDYLKYNKEHCEDGNSGNSSNVNDQFNKRDEDMRKMWHDNMIRNMNQNNYSWGFNNKKGRFPDNQVRTIDNDGRIINLLIKNNISDGEII